MTTVNLHKLINDIGIDDTINLEKYHLKLEIDNGYVKYKFFNDGEGSQNYASAYHPYYKCEGKGICKWCGCTLFNLESDKY